LRVLHIISGLNEGGAEAVLYRLCTFSVKRAGDIVASLTSGGVYAARLRAAGLKVHELAMPRGRLTVDGLAKLYQIIKSTRPDLVQTWMYHADMVGGLMAKLAHQDGVVWGLHNSSLDRSAISRSTGWVVKACALLSGAIPARIISCSEKARDFHVYLGYPPERIIVVPNGYDCELFAPDPGRRWAIRHELGLSHNEPLIGTVARFHPQKDHKNLLDALAMLANGLGAPKCVLVGTGMDAANEELATLIHARGLGDRLHLVGMRTDVPAIMNALDIHVLASAAEAFPNVVAEAMACGTPCVVTDVGDAPLIVGCTGWIVPPMNSGALADAMELALHALREPTSWERRQQACRARIVDNFTLDKMVAGYEALWRRVRDDEVK
jgi:glycosyltransferase involved in cell wall biosynthesis